MSIVSNHTNGCIYVLYVFTYVHSLWTSPIHKIGHECMCVNFAGIYMYILWNILTFCALAACPTFSHIFFDVFFEAEHSCSRNSDLEGAWDLRPRRVSVFRHVLVVVLWWLLHGFGWFFLSRFEEGVFQLQKLEILERTLPKKSTTQQVWQPADFFRVDSQDLHFYHF